jgi:hypothetical protein
MAPAPQPPKWHDGALSALDIFIQGLGVAKDTCGILPAQIAFGTACVILTMIRVRPPPTLRRRTSDLRLSRTRCPTIRISSTLDGLVVMYARYFTGD